MLPLSIAADTARGSANDQNVGQSPAPGRSPPPTVNPSGRRTESRQAATATSAGSAHPAIAGTTPPDTTATVPTSTGRPAGSRTNWIAAYDRIGRAARTADSRIVIATVTGTAISATPSRREPVAPAGGRSACPSRSASTIPAPVTSRAASSGGTSATVTRPPGGPGTTGPADPFSGRPSNRR